MVVYNLNVNGIRLHPAEADPPLVVYPNAILPQPIAGQGFEPVSRNRAQIGEFPSGMNVVQLPLCHRSDALELPAELASKHLLGFFVPERPNQVPGYYCAAFNAIRYMAAFLGAGLDRGQVTEKTRLGRDE